MKANLVSITKQLVYFTLSLGVIVCFSSLLNGCDTNDLMIKEMEAAYATVPAKPANTERQEARKQAVSRAVQKYFPLGMKSEDAFERLRQMKERGFDIGEYRHEGARNWPDWRT